jgi:hypothetical protein
MKRRKPTMFIELNRFLTAEEVQRDYRIPERLFHKLLPKLPVAHRDESGQAYYLESQIDKFLHRLLAGLDDDRDRLIAPDRVRLSGVEYDGLSSLEWRLIKVLLRTAKRAVSIQTAMEFVYGHNADNKDEALRQLVKNLNKRLAEHGCPVSIRFKQPFIYLEH